MRRLLFFYSLILSVLAVKASEIRFTISDGIDSLELKAKIENNVINLLNEINSACSESRALDFSKMKVEDSARQSMAMLWDNTHFMCTDDDIIEHCIMTGAGYQVRNIPLLMKPIGERVFNEEEFQEAVISFDRLGNVESFYLSISMNLYMNVIKSNFEVIDIRRRQLILDNTEKMITAYYQRNINMLKDAMSYQTIVDLSECKEPEKCDWAKQMKRNFDLYLDHLESALVKGLKVKCHIDDIEVMRHPVNPNFYGVTIKKGWNIDKSHDEGYLFQSWDFTNENDPQIQVITWQPEMVNGKPISRDEVYSLSDFDI